MAQHQPGNAQGFTDPNRVTEGSVAKSDGSVATPANYDNIAAMDARLLTLGYNQTQLDGMTKNDKVYAIRVNDDPTTL